MYAVCTDKRVCGPMNTWFYFFVSQNLKIANIANHWASQRCFCCRLSVSRARNLAKKTVEIKKPRKAVTNQTRKSGKNVSISRRSQPHQIVTVSNFPPNFPESFAQKPLECHCLRQVSRHSLFQFCARFLIYLGYIFAESMPILLWVAFIDKLLT